MTIQDSVPSDPQLTSMSASIFMTNHKIPCSASLTRIKIIKVLT